VNHFAAIADSANQHPAPPFRTCADDVNNQRDRHPDSLLLQTPGQNHGERQGFKLMPFAVGNNEYLGDIFLTGPDGVRQNLTGRRQRFLPRRRDIRQFRPLVIGYYMFTRTKVKVKSAHSDLQ